MPAQQRLLQRLLHHPPALEDQPQPLLRLAQHANVFQSVAIQQQQVCRVALCHPAQLVSHHEEVGGGDGGRADQLLQEYRAEGGAES